MTVSPQQTISRCDKSSNHDFRLVYAFRTTSQSTHHTCCQLKSFRLQPTNCTLYELQPYVFQAQSSVSCSPVLKSRLNARIPVHASDSTFFPHQVSIIVCFLGKRIMFLFMYVSDFDMVITTASPPTAVSVSLILFRVPRGRRTIFPLGGSEMNAPIIHPNSCIIQSTLYCMSVALLMYASDRLVLLFQVV